MIKEVSDTSFYEEVSNCDKTVVIDFWAPWCGPCKMIAPVMEELKEELGDVKFVKINVDENPVISQRYRIASIPTILVFKKGMLEETMVGFRPKPALKQMIEKHI